MGRRAYQPDPASRKQVEALAGYGVREFEIGEFLGIDPKILRKHYRRELRQGHVKANAKVAENLYRKATNDGPQRSEHQCFGALGRREYSAPGRILRLPVVGEADHRPPLNRRFWNDHPADRSGRRSHYGYGVGGEPHKARTSRQERQGGKRPTPAKRGAAKAKPGATKAKKAATGKRSGTEQEQLIAMLSRKEGATIAEIVKTFGWQPHTVRGAISGALKKKLGLKIESEKIEDRGRVYRIAD